MLDLKKWEQIARSLGTYDDSVPGTITENSSTELVKKALELSLGKQNLRDAVHYYIDGKPGGELLRGLLSDLKSWEAMQECYEIFQHDSDVERQREAVMLLKQISDNRALGWVPEFLEHADLGIQFWGMYLVDQVYWSGHCEADDIRALVKKGILHPNKDVRNKAKFIARTIAEREG